MTLTIWHNPRCSKSRATLALLRDRGLEPAVRRYLEESPGEDELRAALAALRLPAAKVVRRGERRFRELGLSTDMPESALLAAMVENPVLIERPIVFCGGRAAIGRPPEAVLDIL